MQLIVLAGLVAVEKRDLAHALARAFQQKGEAVALIDNIARLSIHALDPAMHVQRVDGDSLPHLPALIDQQTSARVILALSEQTRPADLFVTLDEMRQRRADLDVRTLALIDLRTCDCFPGVREQLEAYADHVIMLPYQLDDVLALLS